MKKIKVPQLPFKNLAFDVLNRGQINATAMKFRMKIDTLSELHKQLLHHEYKDYPAYSKTQKSMALKSV
ncbi:hypothetical protein ACFQZJ_10900 [Maribacter chungangensis]|uniref:Transposase n=1 Tax=Maribacter chungangensis TaxID=1069117 RepID=A0ABW3B3T3_9FLAO